MLCRRPDASCCPSSVYLRGPFRSSAFRRTAIPATSMFSLLIPFAPTARQRLSASASKSTLQPLTRYSQTNFRLLPQASNKPTRCEDSASIDRFCLCSSLPRPTSAQYNFSGRTLSAELLAVIRRFPKRDQLDEAVGIAFVEITQPTAKHGFLAAGVGAKLVRDPVPQLQATALTQRVRELAKTIPNAYERRAPNKRLQQTPQTRVVCCRVASPRQHL